MNILYRCPYDKAVSCDMLDSCKGCEDFKGREAKDEMKVTLLDDLLPGFLKRPVGTTSSIQKRRITPAKLSSSDPIGAITRVRAMGTLLPVHEQRSFIGNCNRLENMHNAEITKS